MANPEHVEIVMQGAKAIAAWVVKNPMIRLDLSGADLRDADLESADLLSADLSSADLSGVNLMGARLYHTNLSGADLSSADLSFASLYAANLSDADLTGAEFGYTIFGETDLTRAKGLEDVNHYGPCTIGIDTLFKSQGKIPPVFLRGCGVPEELILQLPAIIGSIEPIQFYSCFISYSSGDDSFARRLHARMMAEKLRVWFAPKDIRSGEKVREQIDRAIQVHDRTLLLLSDKSMNSEWVQREIERAREKEKQSGQNVLFPIGLVPYDRIKAWECFDDDSGEELAKKVRAYHIPDFSQWKQEDAFGTAFGELMEDLRARELETRELETGKGRGRRSD